MQLNWNFCINYIIKTYSMKILESFWIFKDMLIWVVCTNDEMKDNIKMHSNNRKFICLDFEKSTY